jgi:hypothetical protein
VEAWSSLNGLQAFVGGGVHYQDVRGSTMPYTGMGEYDNLLIWTIDGLFKFHGFSVMAAYYGMHADSTDSGMDFDNYAATIQGGLFVIPDKLEPFARYEWIGPDGDISAAAHDVNVLTFGGNYFFSKHDAKLTVDMVYVLDSLDAGSILAASGSNGIGLLGDATGRASQVALRAQFQLLF